MDFILESTIFSGNGILAKKSVRAHQHMEVLPEEGQIPKEVRIGSETQ